MNSQIFAQRTVRFIARLAKRTLKLAVKLTASTIESSLNDGILMKNMIQSWKQLENKKFWNCLSCGTKFDLAITEQKETCTVCRLRRVIEN